MGSRIKMIEAAEAEGKLKELYDKFNGRMANILKVHSLNPKSLETHYQYYRAIMFGKSPLKREIREIIGVVVSKVNNCFYWIEHHGAALYSVTKNNELVEGVKEDYQKSPLDKKTKAILDYAVLLTKNPHAVTDEEVEKLRKAGCTDTEILDVCQITSYFNYVNRMADGLGVQLEPDFYDNKW